MSRPPTPRVFLKAGRERSVLRRHPWIFSGAIDRVEGRPQPGDTVQVCAADGRFLAWASINQHSQIRARVWAFEESGYPDEAWLKNQLGQAIGARAPKEHAAQMDRASGQMEPASGQERAIARRLVHAESDGLPGIIVDRYADTLVLQLSTAGADARRDSITDALTQLTGCKRLFERSDADSRELEGLPANEGWLRGEGATEVDIVENGLHYRVDIANGQKTGFYLDQRDARARIRALAAGREVLNCFCYTGGFSFAAMAGGAHQVLSIDSSRTALDLARRNAALNGMDRTGAALEWREADVFRELRALREARRAFDLIVLDPPKFAPTAKHAPAAARAYKDINLGAMRLLRPGGMLATFSCSSGISADLFQKIVAGAAADAALSSVIVQRFQAAADHPVRVEFPEGEYLKGLLLHHR